MRCQAHVIRFHTQHSLVDRLKVTRKGYPAFFRLFHQHVQNQRRINTVGNTGRTVPGIPHIPLVHGNAYRRLQPLPGLVNQLPHPGDRSHAPVIFLLYGGKVGVMGVVAIIVLGNHLRNPGKRLG